MALYIRVITLLNCLSFAIAFLPHPLSDEFINLINAMQDSWKAGRNFPADTPASFIKKLAGTTLPAQRYPDFYIKIHDADVLARLPESFDSRKKWPNCPSLNEIRDQASCGSCWAHGAVEAITDRICIFSNGTQQVHISSEDVLSCVKNGCKGKTVDVGWDYWVKEGIVSGGNYGSKEGCRPYTLPPCEHFLPDRHYRRGCHNDSDDTTPACVKKCVEGYNVSYENDKHFGNETYYIKKDEIHIMAEIYLNGPVEAGFTIYDDFLSYKSGVYYHTTGDYHYGHAIKILGWGVEKGMKYWLAANSWNSDWGDKGYFKILRGENECGIEEDVVTGTPILK